MYIILRYLWVKMLNIRNGAYVNIKVDTVQHPTATVWPEDECIYVINYILLYLQGKSAQYPRQTVCKYKRNVDTGGNSLFFAWA